MNFSDGFNQNVGRNNKIGGIDAHNNTDILVQDFRNQRRNNQLHTQNNHNYTRSKTVANDIRRPSTSINNTVIPNINNGKQ